MLKYFIMLEIICLVIIIAMLIIPTTRGTKKELRHSHIFDDSFLVLFFSPMIYLSYLGYVRSDFPILMIIIGVIVTAVMIISFFATHKMANQRSKDYIESQAKKEKEKAINKNKNKKKKKK